MDEAAQVVNQQARFTLQWPGEAPGVPVPLDVMRDSNFEDPELCAWLNSARIGAEITIGGGAAPQCTVRRVA